MRKTIHQLKKPIYRSAIPPQEIRRDFGDLRRHQTWLNSFYYYLGMGRITSSGNVIKRFIRPGSKVVTSKDNLRVQQSLPEPLSLTSCPMDKKVGDFIQSTPPSTESEQLSLFPLDTYKANFVRKVLGQQKVSTSVVEKPRYKQLTFADIKPEKHSRSAMESEDRLDNCPEGLHRATMRVNDNFPEDYPSYRAKSSLGSKKIFDKEKRKNRSETEKLASDCWYTPSEIVDLVIKVFGGVIDLDPCADHNRRIPAIKHFTISEDGLSHPWRGRVFMNPPYSSPSKWVQKLTHEMYTRNTVDEAIALLPAATDTKWFECCWLETLCFWRGRIRFLNEHYEPSPAPARGSHVLVYFGENPANFAKVFSDHGAIVQAKYF